MGMYSKTEAARSARSPGADAPADNRGRAFFYLGRHRVTVLGTSGMQSIFRSDTAPLAQQAKGTQATHYQADLSGSVLGLLTRSLRPSSYTPYGYSHQAMDDLLLGFNAQPRDSETGNYPLGNGHRLYSPALHRFFSPDALSPFGAGGRNSYVYCEGDPVNRIDPSGKNPMQVLERKLPKLFEFLKQNPDQRVGAVQYDFAKKDVIRYRVKAVGARAAGKEIEINLHNVRGEYYVNVDDGIGFERLMFTSEKSAVPYQHEFERLTQTAESFADELGAAGYQLKIVQGMYTIDSAFKMTPGNVYLTRSGIERVGEAVKATRTGW